MGEGRFSAASTDRGHVRGRPSPSRLSSAQAGGRGVRGHQRWSGASTILALVFVALLATGLPLFRPSSLSRGGGSGSTSTQPAAAAAVAASASAPAPDPTLTQATAPPPNVTPSPEPDPTHYGLAGGPQSSSTALAAQVGTQLIPGYSAVSFRLALTLGSDFASRLDRSIRLYGADNIRYLTDEPVVQPSLLAEPGPVFDGWVTFLLPTAMSGPASIHITVDPAALTELVVPVVIGSGAIQPSGVATPTSIIGDAVAGTSN